MSNINASNIDGAYPVAGQDNDSQGFRTNFTNIKNNLSTAATEITDLQGNVARTDTANNFAGQVVQSAEVKDLRETVHDFGTTGGTITMNHATAHNFTITTNASATAAFSGASTSAKLYRYRLAFDCSNVAHTLTLPAAVSTGTDNIAGYASNVITFSATGVYHYEFTTTDMGETIHIEEVTKRTSKARSATPANTGAAGDTAGDIAFDGSYIYVCTADYDGSTVIWARAAIAAY